MKNNLVAAAGCFLPEKWNKQTNKNPNQTKNPPIYSHTDLYVNAHISVFDWDPLQPAYDYFRLLKKKNCINLLDLHLHSVSMYADKAKMKLI